MLIVGVALGWKVEKARRQRDVVAWILQSGGRVAYDYEWDNGPLRNSTLPGPKWLRELLGIDFFDKVVLVDFTFIQVVDITPLAGLQRLECLDLDNTQVTDVTPLARLISLEILDLDNTHVTDVTPLAELTNLKWLWLMDTPVSQDDYEMLRKTLPSCRIRWSENPQSQLF